MNSMAVGFAVLVVIMSVQYGKEVTNQQTQVCEALGDKMTQAVDQLSRTNNLREQIARQNTNQQASSDNGQTVVQQDGSGG